MVLPLMQPDQCVGKTAAAQTQAGGTRARRGSARGSLLQPHKVRSTKVAKIINFAAGTKHLHSSMVLALPCSGKEHLQQHKPGR